MDLAISRTFKINERTNIIFRAEGTNAFNMVSLGQLGAGQVGAASNGIDNAVGSSTFGVIRVANPMRKLQFGRRLTY